jgi:hypothetical protein
MEAAMRVRHVTVLVGLGLALGLSAGACDEDEPDVFSTGVPGDKPLGSVTPDEAQAVCQATQDWTRRMIAQEKQRQLTCRISAVVAAGLSGGLGGGGMPGAGGMPGSGGTPGGGGLPHGLGGLGADPTQLRMACQTTYDRCLMTPAPDPAAAPAMCNGFPAGCTATVAEYEACLKEIPAFVDRTIAMIPACDTLTALSLLSVINLPSTLPDTCKTFQMKCRGAAIGGLPTTPPGVPTAP